MGSEYQLDCVPQLASWRSSSTAAGSPRGVTAEVQAEVQVAAKVWLPVLSAVFLCDQLCCSTMMQIPRSGNSTHTKCTLVHSRVHSRVYYEGNYLPCCISSARKFVENSASTWKKGIFFFLWRADLAFHIAKSYLRAPPQTTQITVPPNG